MRTGSRDPAGERARWRQWRVQRLLTAGFELALAEQLARQGNVDLHELLELVDRNCPPAQRLSTTRGALYKTLHDARRKLRAAIEDHAR
jgi:hypothetical protein